MTEKTINFIKLPDGETYKIGGSGFNLFDTKVSDHVLEGQEALGWALQGTYVYKEGVAGSRVGYADFYNRCLEEYNSAQGEDVNGTIVGSPTVDGSVVSGFSVDNYVQLPETFNPTTWKTVFKIKTGADYTISNDIFSTKEKGLAVGLNQTKKLFVLFYPESESIPNSYTGNYVFTDNTQYWISVEFTGTQYILSYSTDGTNYTVDGTYSSTIAFSTTDSTTYIGRFSDTTLGIKPHFTGSIDFGGSYVEVNGVKWWNGSNTYKNSNGHKFYPISQKPLVDSIYESTGISDFYGIDTENERIFLPRDKYFAVTGGVKGNGMTLGLTDGSQDLGIFVSRSGNGIGAFKGTTTVGTDIGSVPGADNLAKVVGVNTDPTKSGVVLEPNENKYLYYCVGNTKVESAVSNVTEITTSENDTLPLFHNFYSKEDMTTTGAYVNASLGSYLSGNVYTTAYNELVNKLGTDNVKSITDEYTDYDIVVNQDDMTFRLPLLNGDEDLIDTDTRQEITSLPWVAPHDCFAFINVVRKENLTTAGRITLNGKEIISFENNAGYQVGDSTTQFKVKKGDVIDVNLNAKFHMGSYYKLKGNGNLYYKLSNAVTNLDLLDVAKVTADLNTKLTRDNKEEIAGWGIPDYTAGISYATTGNISFTAPVKGYFSLNLMGTGGQVTINGNDIGALRYVTGYSLFPNLIPLDKNDVLAISGNTTINGGCYFFPMKGAN